MSLTYEPHKYQREVHFDDHRFRVVVWHRRAGKSTLAVNEILRHAKAKPGRYWIILPTYRQAKTVIWPLLLAYMPPDWIRKANESSLEVRMFNGSEIALKGAENKDALRGVGLSGVVLDEYGSMQRGVWSEIILPTLADTHGWALFIGTPYGKNHFFELYNYGLEGSIHPDWRSWRLSAEDSGLIDPNELVRIKRENPQTVWEQEWDAKFIEGAGSVFRRIKENATAVQKDADATHLYRMGVDLARLYNWTAVSIIDRHTHEQVYADRFNELDWNFQRARLEAIARRYNNAEMLVDITGVGDPVVEELAKVGLNIEGFKYAYEKKKLLVENLAKMLEQDRIKIVPNEAQVAELEAFTYYRNPDNDRIRYHAPEGLTDDFVNALALSVWDIGEKLPLPEESRQREETYFENPYG